MKFNFNNYSEINLNKLNNIQKNGVESVLNVLDFDKFPVEHINFVGLINGLIRQRDFYLEDGKKWSNSYDELLIDYINSEYKSKKLDKVIEFIDMEFKEYEGIANTDLYDSGVLYAIEKITDIIEDSSDIVDIHKDIQKDLMDNLKENKEEQ